MSKIDDKAATPSQIAVVPCPWCSMVMMAYGLSVNGQMLLAHDDGGHWCGTESEALAKKAELERESKMSNVVAETWDQQAAREILERETAHEHCNKHNTLKIDCDPPTAFLCFLPKGHLGRCMDKPAAPVEAARPQTPKDFCRDPKCPVHWKHLEGDCEAEKSAAEPAPERTPPQDISLDVKRLAFTAWQVLGAEWGLAKGDEERCRIMNWFDAISRGENPGSLFPLKLRAVAVPEPAKLQEDENERCLTCGKLA